MAAGHNIGQADVGNINHSTSDKGVQGGGAVHDDARQTAQGCLQRYRAAGSQGQISDAEQIIIMTFGYLNMESGGFNFILQKLQGNGAGSGHSELDLGHLLLQELSSLK